MELARVLVNALCPQAHIRFPIITVFLCPGLFRPFTPRLPI